jgi:hypothetical protein
MGVNQQQAAVSHGFTAAAEASDLGGPCPRQPAAQPSIS